MGAQHSERYIASRNHPLIRHIRALVRSGELLRENQVLLETPLLVEDALASGMDIHSLLLRDPQSPAAEKLISRLPGGVEILRVAGSTFETLSTIENSPGVLALAGAPGWSESDLFPTSGGAQLLIVAGVQDPGNLGTMLRAAEAFGFTGAILTRGSASPWNAKAFRAAAGTMLRLPVLRNFSPAQTVQLLRERGVKLYGAVVRGGCAPAEIASRQPLAIALGAEAAGLPPELEQACQPLSIPMASRIDSLNVAAAAAILMYEVARQRGATQH